MKKAEDLAEKYTEEKRKPWDLDACAQNACLNGFMAGYKAALSTKTDRVQILIEALERQTHPHVESFCKERAKNALAAFSQTDEGEGA